MHPTGRSDPGAPINERASTLHRFGNRFLMNHTPGMQVAHGPLRNRSYEPSRRRRQRQPVSRMRWEHATHLTRTSHAPDLESRVAMAPRPRPATDRLRSDGLACDGTDHGSGADSDREGGASYGGRFGFTKPGAYDVLKPKGRASRQLRALHDWLAHTPSPLTPALSPSGLEKEGLDERAGSGRPRVTDEKGKGASRSGATGESRRDDRRVRAGRRR